MSESFVGTGPRVRSLLAALSGMGAAMAMATGAVFNRFGDTPTIHKGKHRVAAETKNGRQFVSRRYYRYLGGLFVSIRNKGGGDRERTRRRAQRIAQYYTPARMTALYGVHRA